MVKIGRRGVVRGLGALVCLGLTYPLVTLLRGKETPTAPEERRRARKPSEEISQRYGDGEKVAIDGVEAIYAPSPEAVKVMDAIADAVGIPRRFEIYAGKFSKSYGALAGVLKGKPTIIYDMGWFTWKGGRAAWYEVGVSAHEVGHLLLSHFLDGGSKPRTELEADQFSGFAVARLGGTLAQALAWTEDLSESGSATHPGRARRREAITKGWTAGQTQKHWEAGVPCRADWASETFEIEGHQCRMVWTCNAKKPARLACADDKGHWVWER